MTQIAIVTKIIDDNHVEINVEQGSACSANCASCTVGCGFQNAVRTSALNKVHARPGDRVSVESRKAALFGMAALTYLVPLLTFLAGCLISGAAGFPEGVYIAVSLAFFLAGAAAVYFWNKRTRRRAAYEITEIL